MTPRTLIWAHGKVEFKMFVRHQVETKKEFGHMGLELKEPLATMKIIGPKGLWSLTLLNFTTMLGQMSFDMIRRLTTGQNLEIWKDTIFALNHNGFVNFYHSSTVT